MVLAADKVSYNWPSIIIMDKEMYKVIIKHIVIQYIYNYIIYIYIIEYSALYAFSYHRLYII